MFNKKISVLLFSFFLFSPCAPLQAWSLPEPKEEVLTYCQRMRQDITESQVISKCMQGFDDTDLSHPADIKQITFTSKVTLQEAFKVARLLFSMPSKLSMPQDTPQTKKMGTQVISNPEKPKEVWEDNLTIKRSPDGVVNTIEYFSRRDGSALKIVVAPGRNKTVAIDYKAYGD